MAKFNWDDHPEVPVAPQQPEQSPSIIDTIMQRAKGVGDQYARAGQTAGDFITEAGRGAVSAALPLTGINTEKIAGGVGALGDVLSGDIPLNEDILKNLGISYDEAKKFAEKYKETQEKRSPIASTSGQLVGGLTGAGALMKGVGAAAPILGELGSGRAISQGLSKISPALAIPEAGGGIGGMIARTGAQAAESAPLGAAYGADAAPEGQGLEGAVSGATLGAGLGGGAGVLNEAGSGIKNLYDASKTIGQGNQTVRQLQLARQVAREGVTTPTGENITSIYGRGGDKITAASDDLAKQATEQLYGARKGLQDQYGKVLTDLDKQGITITPKSDDLLAINQAQNVSNELPGLFGDRGQIDQTKMLLNKFAQGSLIPSEAKQLQLNLRKAASNSSAKGLGAEQSKIETTLNSITDQLESLPNPQNGGPSYQDVNDLYREYSGTMGSLANKGEIDPNYVDKWVSDLGNRSDIKDIMSQMIDYVQRPGATSDDKRLILNKVANHFNDLESSQPGFLKSQGVDFNTIKKNINDMSDLVNTSRTARFEQPHSGVVNKLLGTPGMLGASVVGKVEKIVPQFTQKLFQMPNEALRSITPDLPEHVSSALNNAINTGDAAKRNAVLFSIVQNPDLRKRINKRLGITQEGE